MFDQQHLRSRCDLIMSITKNCNSSASKVNPKTGSGGAECQAGGYHVMRILGATWRGLQYFSVLHQRNLEAAKRRITSGTLVFEITSIVLNFKLSFGAIIPIANTDRYLKDGPPTIAESKHWKNLLDGSFSRVPKGRFAEAAFHLHWVVVHVVHRHGINSQLCFTTRNTKGKIR